MDGDITGADLASAMAPSASPDAAVAPASANAVPSEATTAPPDTGATVPAAATAPPERPDPKPAGPIPLDVHTKALENARAKATAEWERDYGWAKQVKREDYDQAVALAKRATGDKIGFIREYLAEIQADPQYAQALRSEVARALGNRGGNGGAPAQPDVAITDEQGNVVGQAYSAQATVALVKQAVEQALAAHKQELAPVIQTHKTLAEQHQAALDKAEGDTFAKGLYTELSSLPQFEAHKTAIGAEVVRIIGQYPANDPRINEPAFLEATVMRAYNRVVLPKLASSERSAALHDLTTKAQGAGVVPGNSTIGAPKDLKDLPWEEGLRREFARVTAGAR